MNFKHIIGVFSTWIKEPALCLELSLEGLYFVKYGLKGGAIDNQIFYAGTKNRYKYLVYVPRGMRGAIMNKKGIQANITLAEINKGIALKP